MSQLDREQTKKSKAELTTELATVIANAAQSATPKFAQATLSGNSIDVVVDITDKGVLTGITVVFQPTDDVEAVSVELTATLDGVNVINDSTLTSKPAVATTAMQLVTALSFYHPFNTSLVITARMTDSIPANTGMVLVTYTTD